jgi:hypothetical protein
MNKKKGITMLRKGHLRKQVLPRKPPLRIPHKNNRSPLDIMKTWIKMMHSGQETMKMMEEQ